MDRAGAGSGRMIRLMVRKLNVLVFLLLRVAFAASAQEETPGLEPDSIVEVQDTVVAPVPAELIVKAQLHRAQCCIDSLEIRIAGLEEDYAIARGNELSLQRQFRSLQVRADSLCRVNSDISGLLSEADRIKIYYAKNLYRYIATPAQIQKGIEALKSISDLREREANGRFVPGLEQMDSWNREVLRILKGLRNDRRRTDAVDFLNWKEDAKNQLNGLKTRLNESRLPYERLKMVVTVAFAKVNAAKDDRESPDFADLLEEFRYIDR